MNRVCIIIKLHGDINIDDNNNDIDNSIMDNIVDANFSLW